MLTSPKEILQAIKKEISKPAGEIDSLHLLALSVNYATLGLGIEPGRQTLLELRRTGLLPAVRALLTGRAAHDRQLANIALDPDETEARCARIEQLRGVYTTLFSLTEPVRRELIQQETALQKDGRKSYGLVRPLVVAFPHIAATLQPATDLFIGPARRGAHSRRLVKTAVDKTRVEDRVRDDQPATPADDPLLSSAPPLAARRVRRR